MALFTWFFFSSDQRWW